MQPLLAPLQLPVSCSAGLSRPKPRLRRSQCGKASGTLRTPQGALRAAAGRYSRCSVTTAHSIRAAGYQWPIPSTTTSGNLRTAVQRFQACLPRIWRLPWDNRYKEALWRLAVNGVPETGGYGIVHRSACLYGWLLPCSSITMLSATAM
jgi:hypothetical protein